ncbi:MAG: translation initiation factor IF-3 [Fibrobacteres bacterium]|nr:translation initiation factor IF-3 [Fibrobacterota bacterium]
MRINEHIRTYEVRVIDADGKQLGVLTVPAALERAKERGLDLVEVSPTAQPPVCRIMDFGKYKYEISKKAKASKAKQHVIKVKEIKFHPKTGENDYNYRLVQAKEFLEKGFKVKATVVFRGREMAHIEFGARWLKKMTVDLNGIGQAETGSIQEGRNVTTIFAPVKHHVQPVAKPKVPGVPGAAPAPAGAKPAAEADGVAAPEVAKPAPGESKAAAPANQA